MEYITVGKITNTHGIKGEVKVYPLTNDVKRFDFLKYAYIGEEKKLVNIESIRYHKNLVIIKFEEYDDINAILSFKDDFIYVDEKERLVLPKDNYFIYELLNSQVYNKNMDLIGVLIDVIQGFGNDVYVVKNAESQKEYLIPGVKKFITEIDVINKVIIIDPIEGMIE